jgi:CheY-like chemotaxis protein
MAQRILVVEDEPAIADTITYALATDGYTHSKQIFAIRVFQSVGYCGNLMSWMNYP